MGREGREWTVEDVIAKRKLESSGGKIARKVPEDF